MKHRIKLVSDLHLELCIETTRFNDAKFEVLFDILRNKERADTLIIAGDLCEAGKLKHFVHRLPFDEYAAVLYVPGNHEYYRTNIDKGNSLLSQFAAQHLNVSLLADNNVRIGKLNIYGMTYWYNGLSPIDEVTMLQSLNDYRQIRNSDYRKSTPAYFQLLSYQSEKRFFEWAKYRDNILLVTHHPSSRMFRQPGEPDYPGYGSVMNFPPDFDTSKIIAQCHGHTHTAIQYDSEFDIPTYCNAVGYLGYEQINTNPCIIEVEI